jgi:hypothetical protein
MDAIEGMVLELEWSCANEKLLISKSSAQRKILVRKSYRPRPVG